MSADKDNREIEMLRLAIEALAESSGKQRIKFERKALRCSHLNKLLTIVAGLLSLLAAGSIASVLTKLLDPTIMQIIAVVSATISALISAFITAYFNDRTIGKLFSAAAYYLEVREVAKNIYLKPGISAKALHKQLEELQTKYVKGSQMFGEFGKLYCYPLIDRGEYWDKKIRS